MDRQDVSRVQIIRGDARSLPLADDSVDLVVTSPPYLNLRAYQDGGTTYEGDGSQPRCVNTSTGSLTADSTPAIPGGISG